MCFFFSSGIGSGVSGWIGFRVAVMRTGEGGRGGGERPAHGRGRGDLIRSVNTFLLFNFPQFFTLIWRAVFWYVIFKHPKLRFGEKDMCCWQFWEADLIHRHMYSYGSRPVFALFVHYWGGTPPPLCLTLCRLSFLILTYNLKFYSQSPFSDLNM